MKHREGAPSAAELHMGLSHDGFLSLWSHEKSTGDVV